MSKLLAALGLLTFATFATAQGRGVGTSTWTDGEGNNVNVTVTDTPQTPHSVTFQDATGFTPAVNGSVAPGSSPSRPTVSSAPGVMIFQGGNEYRIRTYPLCGQYYATVEKKGPGETGWKKLRPAKRLKKAPPRPSLQPDLTGPGNEGTSLPPEAL